MMRTKGRLLLLATLATISVMLVFSAIQQSQPYLTVTQVVENSDKYHGKEVRVIGVITDASAGSGNLALQFRLADARNSINVMYNGSPPQNFEMGIQAVIVGKLSNVDLIEASSILLKCPSKYTDESQDNTGLNYVFYAVVAVAAILGTSLLVFSRVSSQRKRNIASPSAPRSLVTC